MNTQSIARLDSVDVASLDPYLFMAHLGKRVIHPGGRKSTEELIQRAGFQASHEVLDVGCGVGTTAIEISQQYGCKVTALDISDLMLARATDNVRRAGAGQKVRVEKGDIMTLNFPSDTFSRVIAEAVTMFVDRPKAARELVRVCKPGGMVLATEFLWRRPPTDEARQIFLGEICPGMSFDTLDDWVQIYRQAGLVDVRVTSGPFEMMTPFGFLEDEGLLNCIQFMTRAFSSLKAMQKMIWLLPRMNRAVPYLGYIAISGVKPAAVL